MLPFHRSWNNNGVIGLYEYVLADLLKNIRGHPRLGERKTSDVAEWLEQ